ncbi:MAG: RHS repeat-associated core domain-containing protein [Chloroflexaceae bacterium]|nr:RHS repeat-associated core domain-containing protein [Chloroflexaceae bacterium]
MHDALGSVRHTLDDAGTPIYASGQSYSPFGLPQSGALPAPFGFTGELHSEGLIYLRARWYDPANGTFPSVDPFAGFPTMPYSLHPYQYGYSNPILWTDPSGELAIFVAGRGSQNRGDDPLGNQEALISVWEMGARFANFIRGSTIIASWNALSN